MKKVRILLVVAAVVIAGCQAQEGVPQAAVQPGLPPTAVPDVVVVQTDSTNNPIAALANDIDLSGTGLTITSVTVDQTLPPLGVATATTNGTTVTFTPPAAFTGVVTLLYDIADGDGGTSSGAIAVSVLPIAPPPVALPDVATVAQDSGANDVDVLANDIDLSGGGLTLTGATVTTSIPNVAHTLAIVGNQVRFTPAAAFIGAVVVTYTAADVNGETANGVLTIVVSPIAVPTGPVPVPDAKVVAQDSGATDIDVLANDIDPAGGGLTLSGPIVTASLPNVAHTLAVVGNKVRFTPAAAFAGTVLVTYTATDVNGDSANGVLSIVVSPLALDVGPVPLPDVATVAQDSAATDIDVLANDVDPAGGGLTLSAPSVTVSVPTAVHTVAVAGNKVRFTPAAGFAGVVVITYTATDVNGDSANGVLSIVVSPLADPNGPVPVPDAAVVAQDSGATNIDVLANDVDPAAGGLTLSGPVVTASLPNAVHTVTVNSNQVRFTPAAGFAGVVVITYTATDVNGNSATGVLNVVVTPVDPVVGLVAIPDVATVAQDSAATDIDVLANDVDFAGGGLTLTGANVTSSLPAAAHTVAVVGNKVRFTPAAGFAGVVVITYTASDVGGSIANGVLSIAVSPLAPVVGLVAIPDTASVPQDSAPTDVDVLANDVDFAGGGLTVTGAIVTSSQPAAAHAVSVIGNKVRFTPAAGFAGVVVITYTATDINAQVSNGLLNITVTPTPLVLGPLALPDSGVASSLAGAQSFDVLANDVDPAAGGLTLTNVSIDQEVPVGSGAVALVGNQVQYTPTLAYAGLVLIGYTAEDINGNTTTGQLSLTVTP
jgi:hypothetical protein